MIKDIILKQKNEKNKLLAQNYIPREKINNRENLVNNDLIKVITGPRRAGKSTFSLLLFKDKEFAYINFDDENLVKIDNYDELLKEIFTVYGETKYLLFDEIQNIPNWELFINRLHRQGYNILLTGSNAKLLSKELSTYLTGRHIPIEILPFNFKEFLAARQFSFSMDELNLPEIKGKLLNYLESFIINGGFPELVVKYINPKGYLDTLLDSILFKDIVNRYKIRFPQKIYDLEIYILNNFASELSFRKLCNRLGFNSVVTLEKYLCYLEEAYLAFILNRYSHKTHERISSPKKIYIVDNGYITVKAIQFSNNSGKLMENFVFTELIKKGFKPNHDLFYYKTRNNKEVDFITRQNIETKALIQVVYQVNETSTKEREIKALVEASEELKCNNMIILTWDYYEQKKIDEKVINFIPLWKWLLEF
ncbi:MAG: ATP-binding protein [Candidatus Firestonebacteria bacterium]|nr:ATP-binding protein [Candidatus Firestonebacteria bacterium]